MRDRIKLIQTQQNMSQVQFATETGISTATLSGIYTGRTQPTNAIISRIHERFPQISITWLMFGEGTMEGTASTMGDYATAPKEGDQQSATASQSAANVSVAGTSVASSMNVPTASQGIPFTQTVAQGVVRDVIKNIDKPMRKITEIRVFFDDGTFETFG